MLFVARLKPLQKNLRHIILDKPHAFCYALAINIRCDMSLDAEHLMEQFRITEKVNPAFQFPAALDPHKDVLVIIDMQTYFSSASLTFIKVTA